MSFAVAGFDSTRVAVFTEECLSAYLREQENADLLDDLAFLAAYGVAWVSTY